MKIADEIKAYNLRFEALSIPKLLDIKQDGIKVICTIIDNSYKNITIPNFITHIFGRHPKLTNGKDLVLTESVKLGNNVIMIEAYVFKSALNLKRLENTGNIKGVGEYAFLECASMREIDLPNVEQIEKGAFCKCIGLEHIRVGEWLEEIGDSAFYSCSKLNKIDFPEGLTTIGGRAFTECVGLKSIQIPQSVFKIKERAFEGCTSLENVTFYGEPDTKHYPFIHNLAFKDCTSMKEFVIPDYMQMIGRLAFAGCENLEHVVIGAGVKNLGEEAFINCPNLKTVHIRSSKISDYCRFGNAEVIRY